MKHGDVLEADLRSARPQDDLLHAAARSVVRYAALTRPGYPFLLPSPTTAFPWAGNTA